MQIGCNSLITLYKADCIIFSDIIVVLDGDSRPHIPQYKTPSGNVRDMHFLPLPGSKSPEAIILDALCDCNEIETFFNNPKVREAGINRRAAKAKRQEILSEKHDNKMKRDLYKEWFNQVVSVLESGNFFRFWAEANHGLCNDFKENFLTSYNAIADNLRIKHI